MLEYIDKLLAPEWRKVISPAKLGDDVLRCVRVLCDQITTVTRLILRSICTRPYFTTVAVYADTIKYDSVTGKYTMELDKSFISVFGAALGTKTAIIGRDFECGGNTYRFIEHPSAFGTTSTKQGKAVITFVCIGGGLSDRLNPVGGTYFGATSDIERNVMEEALFGHAPLGLTTDIITACFGCKLRDEIIADEWVEGDMHFALTDKNNLIYAPTSLTNINFVVGSKPDYGAILTPDAIFIAKLKNGCRVISTGLNSIAAFPDILSDYPGLRTVYDDAAFIGAELKGILEKNNAVFWDVNYIKPSINQQALSNYAINPGAVSINAVVTLPNNGVLLRVAEKPDYDYIGDKTIVTNIVAYNCM